MGKKIFSLGIILFMLATAFNVYAAMPDAASFNTRIQLLLPDEKYKTSVSFNEITFSFDAGGKVLVGTPDKTSPEKSNLLSYAQAVLNSEPFKKEEAYKSKDLYDAVIAFAKTPTYDRSLRKDLQKISGKKPITQFVKVAGKTEKTSWDVQLKTSSWPLILNRSFSPDLKMRSMAVTHYAEGTEETYTINITQTEFASSPINFRGLIPDQPIRVELGEGTQLSFKRITVEREKGKPETIISIQAPSAVLFELQRKKAEKSDGKKDYLSLTKLAGQLTKESPAAANDLKLNISKRSDALQEIEYARFIIEGSPKTKYDYTFAYKGKIYEYKQVSGGSVILFNPLSNEFSLATGNLDIKDSNGKDICNLGGGGKLILDLAKGCKIKSMLIFKGQTYSHENGLLDVTTLQDGEPIMFFTDEKLYQEYLKQHPKGPAVLLKSDPKKEGRYTVESKGIVQYKHLNTKISATKDTTETTFNIHNPLNSLWVRDGVAEVEKSGVKVKVSSTQVGSDCQVKVETQRGSKAALTTTEGLMIMGTVKGGKCLPGQEASEFHMLAPSGGMFSSSDKGDFSALTTDDVGVLNNQIPIGVPLENRVNGMIIVIDELIKIKVELANTYGVSIPEQETLWNVVKAYSNFAMWTLQDYTSAVLPGEISDRKKFGIYVQSSVWGLRNLKAWLLNGVPPDKALRMYKDSEYLDPKNNELTKLPGSTQFTYEFLNLVDNNGKVDSEEAIGFAKKFRQEGDANSRYLSFDYLKNDYYAQYYLLMDIGVAMFKLKPFGERSIDRTANGERTLSYYFHTKNLVGPISKGEEYHIGWSGNLRPILLELEMKKKEYEGGYYLPELSITSPDWLNSAEAKLKDQAWLQQQKIGAEKFAKEREIAAAQGDNYALLQQVKTGLVPLILRDDYKFKLEGAQGLTNLILLRKEYDELADMEKKYPEMINVGKDYESAYTKVKWEDLKDFFAQWVDPFLIGDTAVVLAKTTVKGVKSFKAISKLRLAQSLNEVRYVGKSKLVSNIIKPVGEMKNLEEVKNTLRLEMGENPANKLNKRLDALVEHLANIEKEKGKVDIPKLTKKKLLPPPITIGTIEHPYRYVEDLVIRAYGGETVPGLIKFGDEPFIQVPLKGRKETVDAFFINREYVDAYSHFFEQRPRDYMGIALNIPPHPIIIVVPENIVAEEGKNLAPKLQLLVEKQEIRSIAGVPEKEGTLVSWERDYLEEWKNLRNTIVHEAQHADDYKIFSYQLPSSSTLEGRAFLAEIANIAPEEAIENFIKFSGRDIWPFADHKNGQIDVLAEFVFQFGENKAYNSGLKGGVKRELMKPAEIAKQHNEFLAQVAKIKKDQKLYTKLRGDVITILSRREPKIPAETIQNFARYALSVYNYNGVNAFGSTRLAY